MDWIRSTIHSCDIIEELASDFTALYKLYSFAFIPMLTGINNTRFPEIREICLQELANALCMGDRTTTTDNLISKIRGSIHGDPDSGIDPETRGAIFDMLTKGYSRTIWPPYVPPVSAGLVPHHFNTLTLGDLATRSASRLAIPPGSFAEISHVREISRRAR